MATAEDAGRPSPRIEPLPYPPNYSREAVWAALPWREDAADFLPKGRRVADGPGTADVFFIHPTMYDEGQAWNAGVFDADINEQVDGWPIRHQASVFNGAGRVFAPRYRQAHIRVFSMKDSLSQAALDVAYSDVRDAFVHFLRHWDEGRPLIIAAHSQGSWHARRLLRQFFDGEPLQERLVAAYIPGMDIYPSDFQSIAPCQTAVDQQCYCSWMSYGTGHLPPWLGYKAEAPSAIHPILWTTATALTNERDAHRGALRESFRLKNPRSMTVQVRPEGVLWVDQPHIPLVGKWLHRDNWHVGDYNLFWHNIRTNVHDRLDARVQ